ncbi:hypothetical protein [Streptomyces sp. SID13588]|uniref:hypothetical protein n=1 Tax=Streptomyces sp. SID13588 TaxID=2706051 RepID=UPI0013C7402A|nr:hypothetical protein [Streptomyces sp. SID13588]NEA70385.1 hypothetical protein [Streptomyces sp. SID13588]
MQIGSGNTQINVFAAAHPVAQSGYLHQVRTIAPEVLLGREEELAELADFCTRPDAGDYLWWRAKAWAGKSALLSWFVLNPPPRTRIVSFFITARLAAQDDREAFLAVVIEQLATLLGEPVSPYLTAATRAAHMWQLLDAAAAACRQREQRLVLVVDGLDEDRGAIAHSIAALLPARPAPGMRIVVAGRHDPPLPSDVPSGHPLRDPGVERTLKESPYAQIVRNDAERELKRLLRGTTAEQDLLGLVTAAGGGLSGRDLAELTGRLEWEIEEVLGAVAGRMFAWRPAPAPPPAPAPGSSGQVAVRGVYMLGHEELQQIAVRFLGERRLTEYRERLHTWADRYRAGHWPAHTSGYLFRGYFRMLHADGDLTRMIACALDETRHERMRDAGGGDDAALAEITTTQDAILDRGDPGLDLRAMTLLAVRRDSLAQRNTNIPVGLPAVWALLGRPAHAAAMARSIPSPERRARALGALSEALAECDAGNRPPSGTDDTAHDAGDVAHEAESVARTIINPELRASALAAVARVVARIGDADRARHLAREAEALALTVTHPELQDSVLRMVREVNEADRTGDLGREAEGMPMNHVGTYKRAHDLRRIAHAWPPADDVDRAEAQARSRSIEKDTEVRAMVLTATARMAARTNAVDRAGRLAREAEAVARTGTDLYRRQLAEAAHALAAGLARVGEVDRAVAVARTIPGQAMGFEQARALEEVAQIVARTGDVDRALAVVRTIHRSTPMELARVARALAEEGHTAAAETVAGTITDRTEHPLDRQFQAEGLAQVAEALAGAGDVAAAGRLAGVAESRARALPPTNLCAQENAMTAVARAVARMGEADRAEELTREAEAMALRQPGFTQAMALEVVAGTVAKLGDLDRAERLARMITEPGLRASALANVARETAHQGDVDRAERLARTVADPRWQAWGLTGVAEAMAEAGDFDSAELVAREVEMMAGDAINPGPRARARALTSVAEVMARGGNIDRAESMVRTIPDPDRQAWALTALARHAGKTRARPLIAWALRLGPWHAAADVLAVLQPDVLTVIADDLLA